MGGSEVLVMGGPARGTQRGLGGVHPGGSCPVNGGGVKFYSLLPPVHFKME